MSIELLTIILFASLFLLLITGLPIAFSVAAVAAVFALILWGPKHLSILASAGFSSLTNVNLAAIPLFVFLGWIFKSSGVGDDLYEAIDVWLGSIPGGLAVGCLLISVLLGAICGALVAVTFMLGAIALPPMIKRGYDKHLVLGTITVGGLLGLVIPPSIQTIIYCVVVGVSVGKMYLATLIPALLMAILYVSYIVIRCWLNPALGPPAPPEKRVNWRNKIASLRAVILPLLLILAILVGIYGGIMSPLEASSMGAVGALVIAAIYRRLTWQIIRDSLRASINISGMLAFLFIGIACFTSVYEGIGAPELANKIAHGMSGGGWSVIAGMQFALFGFGMVMDDVAMILIFGPIFQFVIQSLGFDPLWYGVVFLVNINIAFLTPPYGFALFIMKAAAPIEYGITMIDVYRGVLPFIGLALIALVLVILFPPLSLWIPNLVIGGK